MDIANITILKILYCKYYNITSPTNTITAPNITSYRRYHRKIRNLNFRRKEVATVRQVARKQRNRCTRNNLSEVHGEVRSPRKHQKRNAGSGCAMAVAGSLSQSFNATDVFTGVV